MADDISFENNELLKKILENQQNLIQVYDSMKIYYSKIDIIENIVTNGIVTKKYYEEKHQELEKNVEEVKKQYKKDQINNRIFLVLITLSSNALLGSLMYILHGSF